MMKLYTADDLFIELVNKADPVIGWLCQFDYGYTDDLYPLYKNTQDKKLQGILVLADFAVVTKDILYRRHIMNEGGFMWPPRAGDEWFEEGHSPPERWRYLKSTLKGVTRLKLPPYGAIKVQYPGHQLLTVFWEGGFYVAMNGNDDIVSYEKMSQDEFNQHIQELKTRGQA